MHPRRSQAGRIHLERGAGVEQHDAAHGLAGLVLFDGCVRPAAAQARANIGLAQGGDVPRLRALALSPWQMTQPPGAA